MPNYIYTREDCMCGADDCRDCNPQNFVADHYIGDGWLERHPECKGCAKAKCDGCMNEI